MCYTEEQMKRYLDILHNYTNQTVESSQLKVARLDFFGKIPPRFEH